MKNGWRYCIELTILTGLFFSCQACGEVKYTVTDLGSVGGPWSVARGINNQGDVVGLARNANGCDMAVLFDKTGGKQNVCLSISTGCAYAINDTGQIVGWEDKAHEMAVLFDSRNQASNMDLGTLGGSMSMAMSINNVGQIVGWARISSENTFEHATLFDPSGNGNNIDLGTLGGVYSYGNCINQRGQIVGYAALSNSSFFHAALFDSTGAKNNIDLGTLPTSQLNRSEAHCINDKGQIVGWCESGGYSHATLFDSTGQYQNVDLGGGRASEAFSINNSGQIVGVTYDSYGINRAVLFDITGSGANIDLNTFIDPSSEWQLDIAYSINNVGCIVGVGQGPDATSHAFLLVPILEFTPLECKMKITPQAINRKSNQPRIQAFIRLPDNISAKDIDTGELLVLSPINYTGEIKAKRQSLSEGNGISAEFDKDALMALMAAAPNGDIELKVVGKLVSGQSFFAVDTVKIIH